MFALLVSSSCDKSGTSCCHLVTRTVTDLLQVVPTRLIQAVRNRLLRVCCHQLVNRNVLRADDDIRPLLKQVVASLLASSTFLQDDDMFTTTGNEQCEYVLLTREIFVCVVLSLFKKFYNV